jgi:hypothetical protein
VGESPIKKIRILFYRDRPRISMQTEPFAGRMPLHTATFRGANSSERVKCAQNASFTDLYFIKPEVSAFFLTD